MTDTLHVPVQPSPPYPPYQPYQGSLRPPTEWAPPPQPFPEPSWAGPPLPPPPVKRSRKGKIFLAAVVLLVLAIVGTVGAVTLISNATTTSGSDTGYNSSDTTELEASIMDTYNAPDMTDGNVSDVTCIKKATHLFSCLLTATGGITAGHEVTVNEAGDKWVTSS